MRLVRIPLLLLALLLALVTTPGRAEPGRARGRGSLGGISFAADVAAVPRLGGGGTIEISYRVMFDDLLFLRHGDGYRARYEMSAILYDEDGKQLAGDTWVRKVDVETYEETNSRREFRRELLTFDVDTGVYRLKLVLQSLDTRGRGVIERRVEVPEVTSGALVLGSVTFERLEEVRPGGPRDFVPNPSRGYGEDYPVARVRVPVYGDRGVQYSILLRVEASDAVVYATHTDTLLQSDWSTEHTWDFSVLDLEVGSYLVRCVIEPLVGGGRITKKAGFDVHTSPKSWGTDFEKMITQISYVASMAEVDYIASAPVEMREQAWEEFWRVHDPDPTTEENEFRSEFLRRLGYANIHFKSIVEGWQTDMGRIYIQYGEPDDVESEPVGRKLYAWEAWYYYNEHMKFIFVDQEGFGEFKLVETAHP